jgi:hypothetical protein
MRILLAVSLLVPSIALADDIPVKATIEGGKVKLVNTGTKTLGLVCFSAPFTVNGSKRLFDWCATAPRRQAATARRSS